MLLCNFGGVEARRDARAERLGSGMVSAFKFCQETVTGTLYEL